MFYSEESVAADETRQENDFIHKNTNGVIKWGEKNDDKRNTYKIYFTVDAAFLLFLFLLVLLLLLVFLGDDIVQVAEVVLGEEIVHGLPHSHQG